MNQSFEQLVEEITGRLVSLSGRDALKILSAVQGKILHDHTFWKSETWKHPLKLALGIKGGVNNISKVERDQEIKDFILSITETLTLTEVRRRIVSKFGEERAPSRAGLSRWARRQAGFSPERRKPGCR